MFYPTTCVRLRYGFASHVLSGFSWKQDYLRYRSDTNIAAYYQVRLPRWICLPQSAPTPFNGDFRHPAVVSLLRRHIADLQSHGILTVSTIAIATRLRLRTRLTPG